MVLKDTSKKKLEADIKLLPPAVKAISNHLQPLEFADIIHDKRTEHLAKQELRISVVRMVLWLTGILLFLSGVVVCTYEVHEYFMYLGIGFLAGGLLLLIGDFILEWWSNYRLR